MERVERRQSFVCDERRRNEDGLLVLCRLDGDRFAVEPYVESAESALRAGAKLREIFDEGVTLYGDDRLRSIRTAMVADE